MIPYINSLLHTYIYWLFPSYLSFIEYRKGETYIKLRQNKRRSLYNDDFHRDTVGLVIFVVHKHTTIDLVNLFWDFLTSYCTEE